MLAGETISVVISTFERPDACERALLSVLNQDHEALEVLVCDNGSNDETSDRFQTWEQRCQQVRYLRIPSNSGTPATTRNLGVRHARGSWVAFLDDDDEWLPHKLSRQYAVIVAESPDVVASNAIRTTGQLYFHDAPALFEPGRSDVLGANPIITSTAVVRRSLVYFPTDRWLRGIEDYAAWLALSDAGARMLVLGEPLARYADAALDRLSLADRRRQIATVRLAWGRALRHPLDGAQAKAATNKTLGAIRLASESGIARVRARASKPR